MSVDKAAVAKRIARIRRAKGLKQDELAKELKICRQTISFWERGLRSPSLALRKKLAEALGIQMEVLFSDSEESAEAMNDISCDVMLSVARSDKSSESQRISAAKNLVKKQSAMNGTKPEIAEFRRMMDEARDSLESKLAPFLADESQGTDCDAEQ